ncbi:MAG: Gfo/Idh/MocA family oxidoreductase [Bacteroidetes bacterium]|nr:Gfo/Idh/MocA family oxidoreductase [Rhodothermia bacterium]MCS7155943.1 Gfo/Idh/MocA family oxidoreductase [Bacteroidota bacterium]MCX7905949.1 Gfo/Idh/MocA family oxidoreductase [Bacteroidota bacterium]MDW8138084.1 Gfo/Idh/MocA family oxidoreductase [Bacteroidota bacterium]MDW8285768.1 Gfo/Idh/MocA family oxidoreductase [Bacteroidota bacterium]
MRIGIAGYGGFGQFLHEAWRALAEVEVLAVATLSPQGRDLAVARGVRAYSDWRSLVRDPEVELVAVATPPDLHAPVACAALRAGKPVLVEKPLAVNLSQARRILRARDLSGLPAAIDYPLRFHPLTERLHRWARSGLWGPLRRIAIENYAQDEALGPEHWFWDLRRSGGILVEHAVHFIDLAQALASAAPVRIRGLAAERATGERDRMLLEVLYADGMMMTQYHAFGRPGFFERTSWRFVFDRLELELEGWIPLVGRLRALVDPIAERELCSLPNWQVLRRSSIAEAEDNSRPPGWGQEGLARRDALHRLRVHGLPYAAEALIEGTFAFPESKAELYARCVQAALLDLLQAMRMPGHTLRAPLEVGLDSLHLALQATRSALQGP